MTFSKLKYLPKIETASVKLPASKSIANRLLIAQALSSHQFTIENLSDAEDTKLLNQALASNTQEIDVGMAGTAYRFLTAYYAIQEGRTTILKGEKRMHQRPIGILVEALKELGAEIEYLEKDGFPPLRIKGKPLQGGIVRLDGSVSSQYISALLLVAPYFTEGVKIDIQNNLTSRPYVEMTLNLMQQLGINFEFNANSIKIMPGKYSTSEPLMVEADWSSAAFFYQLTAFTDKGELVIEDLKLDSIQGDKRLVSLFEKFGVTNQEIDNGILLSKSGEVELAFDLDLHDCPDLIPSIAVCAAVLCKEVKIRGVKTLRIKESDRVMALQTELSKIGAELIDLQENEILIKGSSLTVKSAKFNTYNDHRMAMALALLALKVSSVSIENRDVVEKSFPSYWREIEKCGVELI